MQAGLTVQESKVCRRPLFVCPCMPRHRFVGFLPAECPCRGAFPALLHANSTVQTREEGHLRTSRTQGPAKALASPHPSLGLRPVFRNRTSSPGQDRREAGFGHETGVHFERMDVSDVGVRLQLGFPRVDARRLDKL